MNKLLLICLALVLLLPVFALDGKSEEVFSSAVSAYENRNFEEALQLFLQLDNEKIKNDDLYYNIGNCYYRLHEAGPAILYYQKALKINPLHQSAKRDLNYALSNIQDKINVDEEDAVSSLWKKIYHSLPLNILAWVSLALFLVIIAILHWITLKFRGREKTVPIFCLTVTIFIFALVFTLAIIRWNGYSNQNSGVLLNNTTIGYSGPSPEFTRVFTIHEGMIFEIEKEDNGWSLIKLPNGIGGWISSGDIGVVK